MYKGREVSDEEREMGFGAKAAAGGFSMFAIAVSGLADS
jgi:hypothetical protein